MVSRKKRINITCAVVVMIILAMAVSGCSLGETRCKDVSRYPEILSEHPNLRTGYLVFPKRIPDGSLNDAEFFFYEADDIFDPSAEIVLRCTYHDADFAGEIERLEKLVKTSPAGEKPILKDDGTRFSVPAYIAEYADDYSFEYAAVTGQREITYVYLSFRPVYKLEAVPVPGLPLDYPNYGEHPAGSESRGREPKDSYNIYEFLSTDKDGNPIRCISYTEDDWPVH